MRHLRAHPLEYLALFLALGGVAYARPAGAQELGRREVDPQRGRHGLQAGIERGDGANVADGSLGAADLTQAARGDQSVGRSATVQSDACDPQATAVTCASVTLHLAEAARVLVEADGRPAPDLGALGTCQLAADGAGLSPGNDNIGGQEQDSFAVTGVTGVLSAGSHTLAMTCSEQSPDFKVEDTHISAVSLSAN